MDPKPYQKIAADLLWDYRTGYVPTENDIEAFGKYLEGHLPPVIAELAEDAEEDGVFDGEPNS